MSINMEAVDKHLGARCRAHWGFCPGLGVSQGKIQGRHDEVQVHVVVGEAQIEAQTRAVDLYVAFRAIKIGGKQDFGIVSPDAEYDIQVV